MNHITLYQWLKEDSHPLDTNPDTFKSISLDYSFFEEFFEKIIELSETEVTELIINKIKKNIQYGQDMHPIDIYENSICLTEPILIICENFGFLIYDLYGLNIINADIYSVVQDPEHMHNYPIIFNLKKEVSK